MKVCQRNNYFYIACIRIPWIFTLNMVYDNKIALKHFSSYSKIYPNSYTVILIAIYYTIFSNSNRS